MFGSMRYSFSHQQGLPSMYIIVFMYISVCVLCRSDAAEARVTMKFAQEELSLGFPRPHASCKFRGVKHLTVRHTF